MQNSIDKSKFTMLPSEALKSEAIVRPSQSYWKDAWRRLRKNKLAMAGLIILIVIALMAIFAPMFSQFTYDKQHLSKTNVAPNGEFWFGTDDFGRDMWTRIWWGARISLFIGVTAALIDLVLGVIYGGISGYYGGKLDDVMQRVIEIIIAIPILIIAILLIMTIGPGISTIILAYALVGWTQMARLVRAQTLTLKENEYVLAARTLGASPWRIIIRHLLPNALGIIIVQITFAIPGAIFFESFMSFIGVGVRVPMASLGSILSDAVLQFRLYPFRVIIPTIVFSLILLSFNLLGDGMRDALDPKMRK